MTLLRQSAAAFRDTAYDSALEQRLADLLRHHSGQRPSPAEMRSWRSSLPVLAADLVDAGLEQVEVLVEHRLPLTSQRIDVVLAGRHPASGDASYVVIELKQWSAAILYEHDPQLVVVAGASPAPRQHPILQVRGYCSYLTDFSLAINGEVDRVAGAAYLHNATEPDAVAELRQLRPDDHGRLFLGSERSAFLDFLRSRLATDSPGAPFADALLNSRAAPSRQLLTVAAEEVQQRERFTLMDKQRLAHDLVLHEVQRSRRADNKAVVIVSGGPGSGKSVIALSLLGELARRGDKVLHATGSRSFTQTLRKIAGKRAPRVQRMFKYFNQFMEAEPNSLDVLVLDEAHRIRETSVDRYTPQQLRTGRPQIGELIDVARVPVFLLDQNQVVRPGELGTVEDIRNYAEHRGLRVHEVDLDAQYRCGGSDVYLRWARRLLGLDGGALVPLEPDPAFDVRVASEPGEMEDFLAAQIEDGYSARMTAGYCWPWSDPSPDGQLVADVQVGGWARPWNLKGDRSVGGAPPAALWATDEAGFDQVGCIYTAQGFEYDWSGVILGPDLVWRGDRLVSERAANRDPDFRNRGRVSDAEFDRLVRHVYKVLLTRGMVGTVLFSTDAETNEKLRELVPRRIV